MTYKGITLKPTIANNVSVEVGASFETENKALFDKFIENGVIKELKVEAMTKEFKGNTKTKNA
jgi:acylphosphatase